MLLHWVCNVREEKMQDNPKDIDPSNWKDEVAIYGNGEACRVKQIWGRVINISIWTRVLIRPQNGDVKEAIGNTVLDFR